MANRNLLGFLGKLTLQNAIRCYSLAASIKCVPFELVSQSCLQVQLFPAAWRRFLWHFVNAIYYTYYIFQILAFSFSLTEKGLVTETAMHIFYIGVHTIGILYFSALFTNAPEAVKFINQLDFVRQRGSEILQAQEYFHLLFIILSVHYLMCILIIAVPPGMILIYVMNPEGAMYVFSHLPPDWKTITWIKIVFIGFELAIWYWVMVLLNVCYVFWSGSVFQTILYMKALKKYLASNQRSCIQRSYALYREIQIFNCLHNDLNAAYFTPGFCSVTVLLSVLFIYCSLKAYHLLPIFIYLLFPICAAFIIFLQTAFYLYICEWRVQSRAFKTLLMESCSDSKYSQIMSANSEETYALMKRRVRSLRLIENQVGIFGYTSLLQIQATMEQIMTNLLLLLSF